jgi:hypothetical protein
VIWCEDEAVWEYDCAADGLACGAVDGGSDCFEEDTSEGCEIEGVAFDATEAENAIWWFEEMTCDECEAEFDSRVCEDALNDRSCMFGSTCTGCSDDDTVADGTSCEEIAGFRTSDLPRHGRCSSSPAACSSHHSGPPPVPSTAGASSSDVCSRRRREPRPRFRRGRRGARLRYVLPALGFRAIF